MYSGNESLNSNQQQIASAKVVDPPCNYKKSSIRKAKDLDVKNNNGTASTIIAPASASAARASI